MTWEDGDSGKAFYAVNESLLKIRLRYDQLEVQLKAFKVNHSFCPLRTVVLLRQ